MACEGFVNALTDTATGASPSREFDAHVAACADCRTRLALLRQALAVADQELAHLSTAMPTAGFVARVRTAVAQSGSAPAWRAGWLWPSVATSTAVVVALAVAVVSRPPQVPATVGTQTTPQPAASVTPAATPELPVTIGPGAEGTAPKPPRRAQLRRVVREPEVLVPAGEPEALLRLVALMASDQPAPPMLNITGQLSPALAELHRLDIAPLEIVPLEPLGELGT